MKPAILIVALNEKWIGISRLPEALQRAGFYVAALCPSHSYLAQTRYLDLKLTYPVLTYTRSKIIYFYILFTLLVRNYTLVVPGDEDALLALENLRKAFRYFGLSGPFLKLLDRSLGSDKYDVQKLNKTAFIELCQKISVRVPKNLRVANLAEAQQKAQELGFPLVVKADFGYGASGVSVCHNLQQLEQAFRVEKNLSFLSSLKQWIKKLLFIVQPEAQVGISLQQYITGQVGQIPFVAIEGKVLAYNCVIKLETYPGSTGPTSVARSLDNPEMIEAVLKVSKELQYCGFGSLDFIVEQSSGKSYVIELNPRPTPVCHFSQELAGVDLAQALSFGIKGQTYQQGPFKPYTVALFPNEQNRDAQSPYLRDFVHDVPMNDPKLKQALEKK